MEVTNLSCNSSDSACSKTEELSSPQEKVLSSGIQLRTSARVSKKLRLDQEAALAAVNGSNTKKEEVKEDHVVAEKRRARRAPVLWSPEDQAAFFEALNEHGKNFYAIEKYMASRAKRRGDHSAKNREMSRHFYYRSWHKLSKYVHFPESINKVTQELYALINFGELRKKVGHITEKNAQKLNELIYSGSTQVRVKGKSWRVKTPVCRALRKLNHFEDDREEIRLPSRVEVFLTARTNKDAVRVQSVGHNPRVRTYLTLDTNTDYLSSVLGRRWATATSNAQEVLKVGARKSAVPTQTTYTVGRVVTSSSVSLQSHEKRIGNAASQVDVLLSQLQVGKTKSALKWQREGSGPDELLDSPVVDPNQIDDKGNLQDSTAGTNVQPFSQQQPSGGQQTQSLSGQQQSSQKNQEMTLAVPTRIGHLYLLYGSKGVLELEYWWDRIKTEGQQPPEERTSLELDFTKALRKLVSIAKLHHYKTKVECPCGHICRSSVKPSAVQSKASKQNKVPKKIESNQTTAVSLMKIETSHVISAQASSVPVGQMRVGFKQPLLPAPLRTSDSSGAAEDLRSALHHFRPKYCSRRGRARQRSVVVQRMLPLLPKARQGPVIVALQVLPTQGPQATNSANNTTTATVSPNSTSLNVGLPTKTASLVNMSQALPSVRSISLSAAAETTAASSVISTAAPSAATVTIPSSSQNIVDNINKSEGLMKAQVQSLPLTTATLDQPLQQQICTSLDRPTTLCGATRPVDADDQVSSMSSEGGTNSLGRLLNIHLSQEGVNACTDDISLSSTFKGILGYESNSGEVLEVTPPTSPSRLLKEGEGQWLSSEVTDFSLSSFLGHLESPMKTNGSSEDTHMSTDVESHFQSLMAENSLDYTAKFADLAAKIAGNFPQSGNVSVPPP